jgi:hypothetical protein
MHATGGPADVTGVVDAMEAITVAAERLYAEAKAHDTEVGEPDGADHDADIHADEDEASWPEPEDEDEDEPRFRYWLSGDDVDEPLERSHPLSPGDIVEAGVGSVVAESISPPEPDGVRPVAVRRLHPLPTDQ